MTLSDPFPRDLLHTLTERQREVVRWYYGLDRPRLPVARIAERVGCSLQRIYQTLHAARRRVGLDEHVARPERTPRSINEIQVPAMHVTVTVAQLAELAQQQDALSPTQHRAISALVTHNGDTRAAAASIPVSVRAFRRSILSAARHVINTRAADGACPLCGRWPIATAS